MVIDEKEVEVTKELLDQYTKAWSEGHPIIDDTTYDRMVEEYVNQHGESARPFTRSKQSDAVNDIVGTLPKVYGVTTPMRENQKVYKDWETKNLGHKLIMVQPKLDGCSVAFDCNTKRYSTRGDYDNGESVDVTELFQHMTEHVMAFLASEDMKDAQAVKFEVILPVEIYDQFFKDKYKRPRDVVSATITSRNMEYSKCVTLFPLRIYANGHQYIPMSFCNEHCKLIWSDDYDAIQTFIDMLLGNYAHINALSQDGVTEYTYECDGVVVSKVDTTKVSQESLDSITPEKVDPSSIIRIFECQVDVDHEVAIKILNNVQETKLLNIEWQFGRSGRVTPVAIVEPVKFGNVTVTNIGLSTFERVSTMNLRYHDTVRIVYNIVPYFLDSRHDGDLPIPIPNKCPMCGHPMDMHSLKQVRCTNPECKGRKLGSIIRYATKLKMFGVSEGILTKLFDLNIIHDIDDLYALDKSIISTIEGFGDKSADNILNSIKQSSTNVPVWKFLGALPCKDVSDKTWRIIIESVYGVGNNDMPSDIKYLLSKSTPEEFLDKVLWCTVGVGNTTLANINEGIRNNWNTISNTSKYVTFQKPKRTSGVICMTGTRDKRVIQILENKGFTVTDSMNRNVSMLIVPDHNFESKKTQIAKINHIRIYTVDEIISGILDK